MSYLDAICLCTAALFILFICIPMIKEKYLINKSTNELLKKLDKELAKHEDKKE